MMSEQPTSSAEITSRNELAVVPADAAPATDRWTVRIVVLALAVYVMAGLLAEVVLVLNEKRLPEAIETTLATALGALGAVLVSTRSSPG